MESSKNPVAALLLLIFLTVSIQCQAQLSPSFYDKTCPSAATTIRTSIRQAIARERRMAASLIRLYFHDCFVKGCDASILLEQTSSIESEQSAPANNNSVRGYGVIEAAKQEVEKKCPGIVSCADVLATAVRDASVYVGGPTWDVKLGRRDSTAAFKSETSSLPAFFEDLDGLLQKFSDKGFNAREMVALSGAHTLGQAQCLTFRDHIYTNRTPIDDGFASTRKRQCPSAAGNGDRKLAALDFVTPNSFDNNYFKNLIEKKGLLHSDQVMFNGSGSTDTIVSEYSQNTNIFAADFAAAMVKMGDLEPLTGSSGIIRSVCSAVN